MKKSDLSIAIIEDDRTLGVSLMRLLKHDGYTVHFYDSPDKALLDVELKGFNLIIADCMLPKINGIDLIKKIREKTGEKVKVILMSGIFKDNNFVRDSVDSTGASTFLFKPFDHSVLSKSVRNAFVDELGLEFPPLYDHLAKSFSDDKEETLEILSQPSTHNGCEIPFLLSLIMANDFSGVLNIKYDGDEYAQIKFHRGNIYQVKSDDTESYFGVLLIEKGFSTPEEIARGLAFKSEYPIGKRLWALNALSPHAIQVVQREQMSIRMSQIIQQGQLLFEFIPEESDKPQFYIDKESFKKFLAEWISSKIKSDWLKKVYEPWMEHPIVKGPNFASAGDLRVFALLNLVPGLVDDVKDNLKLVDIAIKHEDKPFLFQALHFLLLTETVKIGHEKTSIRDFKASINRVKRFKDSLVGKNHYEIFGLPHKASLTEIHQAYHNFAITLHPDKLPPNSPKELLSLSTDVFQKVTEIYQLLSDSKAREKYDFELEHGEAEQIIKTESLFEKGMIELKNNNFNASVEAFEEVYELKSYNEDFLVFFCWALLKRGAPPTKQKSLISSVDKLLTMIPQEKRHNSDYFYVKGLYYKLTADHIKASIAFKHSFTLNPSFKAAQFEWMSLERRSKKRKNNESTSSMLDRVTSIIKKISS